jgi:hypothetical protein
MSTGAFVASKYTDSLNGNIHPIRVQPETLTLTIGGQANAAPAGAINSALRAFSSSRRRRGAVCARKVGLVVTAGGDNEYEVGSILYVPVLQPTTLATYLDPPDQTGTYNGASVRVVGSSGERYNP